MAATCPPKLALTSVVRPSQIETSRGVYDFTRIPPELNDPMAAAIGLRGLRNLTIRGSGIGATILRLMLGLLKPDAMSQSGALGQPPWHSSRRCTARRYFAFGALR